MKIAGIKFAIFISVIPRKLKPIAAMIRLPTADISRIIYGVRRLLAATDRRVIED